MQSSRRAVGCGEAPRASRGRCAAGAHCDSSFCSSDAFVAAPASSPPAAGPADPADPADAASAETASVVFCPKQTLQLCGVLYVCITECEQGPLYK